MRRFLPHPLLSLALVAMWLLLTAPTLGNLVLGVGIGLLAGKVFSKLEPDGVQIRAYLPLVRLVAIVSRDIVRSNYDVARLILTDGRHGARRSAFVEIPLRLRNPHALALLAIILTATPGTAWLEFDAETGILVMHVFDMIDEEAWKVLVRDRYEALLLEAFG